MSEETHVLRYKILPDKNLLIELYEGIINPKVFIKYKIAQSKDKNFNPDLNILVDFGNSRIHSVKPAHLQIYTDFLRDHPELVGLRRIALWAHNPHQMVVAVLYKKKQSGLKQHIQIFSNLDYAVDWLNLDISLSEVESILDELKNGK